MSADIGTRVQIQPYQCIGGLDDIALNDIFGLNDSIDNSSNKQRQPNKEYERFCKRKQRGR